MLTLYFKVLFMTEQNQPVDSLSEVRDIRKLMERSSRFTSLSGLSFIAAGICACIGAWMAYWLLSRYYGKPEAWTYNDASFSLLRLQLLATAAVLLGVAGLSALFFTWRKARKQGITLMHFSSRRVFFAMAVPLVAGGVFLLGQLRYDDWRFIAPGCLLFYGLALLNASKYTVADIRLLALAEIILGLLNTFYINYGFHFWVLGFGVLHLVTGFVMWWKYDRV